MFVFLVFISIGEALHQAQFPHPKRHTEYLEGDSLDGNRRLVTNYGHVRNTLAPAPLCGNIQVELCYELHKGECLLLAILLTLAI